MKRLVLLGVLCMMSAGVAFGQGRPSILVTGGYQGAKMTSKNGSKINMTSGARIGAALDYPVWSAGNLSLSIQPGLHFSMKGWGNVDRASNPTIDGALDGLNLPAEPATTDDKVKVSLYYLEMPVLANLWVNLTNDIRVFVNAGPYLAYGLGGKSTLNGQKFTGNPFAKSEVVGFNINALKRFDWGVQVGAGVEYRRFLIGLGTSVGLADTSPSYKLSEFASNYTDVIGEFWGTVPGLEEIKDKNLDDTNRNMSFFVTVGYRF